MQSDDQILLRQAAERDCDAFSTLVERHQASVYRFARSITKSDAAAEDVLQETFLRAYSNAGTFSGEGSVRSWLFTIVRRSAIRLGRRRAGEPEVMVSLQKLGEHAGWGQSPDPEAAAMHDQVRSHLSSALAKLNPTQREILVLRELEGYSGPEVCEILGLTLPAMKSRLHRARLAFAAELHTGGYKHGA